MIVTEEKSPLKEQQHYLNAGNRPPAVSDKEDAPLHISVQFNGVFMILKNKQYVLSFVIFDGLLVFFVSSEGK